MPDLNSGYAEKQPRPLASRLREARDLAASRKLENSIFRRQASGNKRSLQSDQFPEMPGNRDDS
jgi:hypothetical protein